MVAFFLLLVVIIDTAITGYLLATVKGLKKSVTHNARLIREICREDGRDADADAEPDFE